MPSPTRQLSAVSNDTAVSKVGSCTSQGLQKSASSAAKFMGTVSTPVSSECHSSRNLTVLDGGLSSLWPTNQVSEMSVDSEMLRVSEPGTASSRHLTGSVHDAASAVDATSVDHGEGVTFFYVVETPSDSELRKTRSDKMDETDKIISVEEDSQIRTTSHQSEPSYPRRDEDLHEYQDNLADIASHVQITNPTGTGIEQRKTSVEHMFDTPNDNNVVATQSAGYTEGIESHLQSDIAEHVTNDLGMEADKISTKLSSEIPTTDVEVPEDRAVDVTVETAVVQASGDREAWPVIRPDARDMQKISPEDLPASIPAVDLIDVLPLNELPPAVGEVYQTEAEITVDQKEESLSSVAEHDQETYSEWPPLPSDEELQISTADLEQSSDGYLKYSEDKDAELCTASPQLGASVGTESGTLTKVGASEKVLTHAAHLTDVDSMHRFK